MKLEMIDNNKVTSPESISYVEEVPFNEFSIYNPYIRNKGRLKILGSFMAVTIGTIVPNTIDAKQFAPFNTSIEDLVKLENNIEIEPEYYLLQELQSNVNVNSPFSSLSEANFSLDKKTADFDTEISLPIKKVLTVKARIKSISKFVPKPFLD